MQATFDEVVSQVMALVEAGKISDELAGEYLDGLEDSFEPSAYTNISDEKLLADIAIFVQNS